MKVLTLLFALISLVNCSSTGQDQSWDSGGQRQQAMEDEARGQNDKNTKDQFVSPGVQTENQPSF